jgi:hypothetical protein
MYTEFESVHNFLEQEVFREVTDRVPSFPEFAGNIELLADVACLALNRLPPRYIRNSVDMQFFMSNEARGKLNAAVGNAVDYAFRFMQSRLPRAAAK